MRGSLICVAGADGSGKTTLIEHFINRYNSPDFKLVVYKYPNRNTVIGKKIDKILKGEMVVSKDVEIKLFADNRAEDRDEITKLLNSGVNVILDRYVYCSLAYTMTAQYATVMENILHNNAGHNTDIISDKFMFRKVMRHDKENLKPDLTILVYGNFLHKRNESEIYDYKGDMRSVLYNNYIVSFLNTETKFCSIFNDEGSDLNELVKDMKHKIYKYAISDIENNCIAGLTKPISKFK
jgi:thymidylate kinase